MHIGYIVFGVQGLGFRLHCVLQSATKLQHAVFSAIILGQMALWDGMPPGGLCLQFCGTFTQ